MAPLLASSDVAERLGVSVATVKRWANEGVLPFVRTVGRHRRFALEDVERFRRLRVAAGEDVVDSWIRALLHEHRPIAVEAMLLGEHARHASWFEVAEVLGLVLDEVGRRWEHGRLSILGEHVASTRLWHGLAHMVEWMPVRSGAPGAMLATPPGEQHVLGLAVADLCLRSAGWRTTWAGRELPPEELARDARGGRVDALVLSASVASRAEALSDFTDRLASQIHGTELVLGGRGAWPHPRLGERLVDFDDLREWMSSFEARPRGAV
jgi:excisionase family DNA binding protein